MKRLLLLFALTSAFGFAGCSKSDNNPTSPGVDAPTDLTALLLSGNAVRLNWTDNSFNEAGFRIERAVNGGAYELLGTAGEGEGEYTDSSTSEGTSYRYQVRAYLMSSVSVPTNSVSVAIPPNAPKNLVVQQDEVVPTQINLSWEDASSVETGIEVWHRISRGEYIVLDTLDANSTTYADTGLAVNSRYTYRVRSLMNDVVSAYSNEGNATTTVNWPNAPSGLTVVDTSANEVRLTWDDNSQNEDGFILERSLSAGTGWEVVDTIRADVTVFTVTLLTSETTYYFRIKAYNTFGPSAYSDIASVETLPGPPVAPSDLVGGAQTYNQVILTWTDNSDDEQGFRLQTHGYGTSRWQDLATLEANANYYVDNTVVAASEYFYRVCAWKVVSDTLFSTWSNAVDLTTPEGPPAAPHDLVAEVTGNYEVSLHWTLGSQNADNIVIERMDEAQHVWTPLSAELGHTQLYHDVTVELDSKYWYRVYAINAVGQSGYSNEDSVQTRASTIHSDGFETYGVGAAPSDPWVVTNVGSSSAAISDQTPHQGVRELRFIDAAQTAGNGSTVYLDHETNSLQSGHFECWLRIAPGGYFGIFATGGAPNYYYLYQLQFSADSTILCRNGRGNAAFTLATSGYVPGTWFHVEVNFNVAMDVYDLLIDGTEVANSYHMQNTTTESASRLMLVTFTDVATNSADVDDVLLRIENVNLGSGPMRQVDPNPPASFNPFAPVTVMAESAR